MDKRVCKCAFTSVELLVVIAILGVLMALALLGLAKARMKAQRIHCVGHLKNIGLGYRIYSTDNGGRFPWQSTNHLGQLKIQYLDNPLPYFQQISNELSTPKIIVCPADTRREAENWETLTLSNVSYFLGLDAAETFPQSLLAGDRNITTNGVRAGPGLARLAMNTVLDWDNSMHAGEGAVAMGDGSVQQMNRRSFRDYSRWFWSETETNRATLAIP